MKYFLVLAFVAVAQAGNIHYAGIHHGGTSNQFRSQDAAGNYAFGYDEGHGSGGTFRRESGHAGAVVGSYGLRDADGRVRTVNYVADGAGFRANVHTNEPGVDASKDPADTLINKDTVVAAVHAAPVHHAVSYAAHAVPAAYGHFGYGYNTAAHHGYAGHYLGGLHHGATVSVHNSGLAHGYKYHF